jgi:hypothetical protein
MENMITIESRDATDVAIEFEQFKCMVSVLHRSLANIGETYSQGLLLRLSAVVAYANELQFNAEDFKHFGGQQNKESDIQHFVNELNDLKHIMEPAMDYQYCDDIEECELRNSVDGAFTFLCGITQKVEKYLVNVKAAA